MRIVLLILVFIGFILGGCVFGDEVPQLDYCVGWKVRDTSNIVLTEEVNFTQIERDFNDYDHECAQENLKELKIFKSNGATYRNFRMRGTQKFPSGYAVLNLSNEVELAVYKPW
ncbi:hypothetical protein QWY82_02450 [Simiduia curdlanivorans]|uniref:Lipoprotein n=1 Tax=Simiduia curdlanivorans TaxID=1492769 RepID=A0ABV8V1C5_9GAMM|nr:hypothetical protein [Simiduia curdlanivorans]MDN3637659.1 hypothetical protein [Simiduia curdlanivorans]